MMQVAKPRSRAGPNERSARTFASWAGGGKDVDGQPRVQDEEKPLQAGDANPRLTAVMCGIDEGAPI